MKSEDLEKLYELKGKGVISNDEFESAKKDILNKSLSENKSSGNIFNKIIDFVFCVIFAIIGFMIFSEEEVFACNEATMKRTQSIINKAYPNLNNSLKLMEPQVVEQSSTKLKCKAKSNYEELPVIFYTVQKQPDGEVLIRTNLNRFWTNIF